VELVLAAGERAAGDAEAGLLACGRRGEAVVGHLPGRGDRYLHGGARCDGAVDVGDADQGQRDGPGVALAGRVDDDLVGAGRRERECGGGPAWRVHRDLGDVFPGRVDDVEGVRPEGEGA